MPKSNIIIVEDELIIAQDIKRILVNLGYTVSAIVTSGEDALKKIDALRPDLVLMDIKLNGKMNGIEAAGKAHALYDVPVVYMTANADEATVERAKKTQPYGFIYKPVQMDVLRASIEMALYKHGMEKQLKEREAWLNATLSSIGDAVIATDKQGKITFLNPVAEELTGWKQAECQGLPLAEVFHIINAITRKRVANPVTKVLKNGAIVGLANHTVLIAKDGREFQIADSAAPIHDAKGMMTGVVLVFRDVTEEYRIQEALSESEEKFRLMATNTLDTVWTTDLEFNITFVNDAILNFLGYTPEEFIGLNPSVFTTPEGLKAIQKAREQLVVKYKKGEISQAKFELRQIRKEGAIIDVEITANLLLDSAGQLIGFQGRSIDITERKQTAIALQESERKIKTWIENSPVCTKVVDLDFNLQFMSESGVRELKIDDITEYYGKPYPLHFYPDSFKIPMRQNLKKVKETGEIIVQEAPIVDVDGNELWYHSTLVPVKDDKGQLDYIMVVSLETTERRQAIEALKENETKFRNLFENKGTATGIFGEDSLIRDCNTMFEEMSGYSKSDIIDKMKWSDFVVEEDLERLQKYHSQRLKKGDSPPSQYECRINKKNGEIVIVIVNIALVGENRIVSLTDITEHKQVEEALRESEGKFHSVLRSIDDLIFVLDRHNRFISAYSSEDKLYLKLTEFIGKKHSEVMPVHIDKLFAAAMTEIKKGETAEYEYQLEMPDGLQWYNVKLSPIMENDEYTGLVAVARDITGRKQTEADLKKLSVAIEQSPAAVAITNLDGNLEYVNPKFCELTGYTLEEVIGRNPRVLKSGEIFDEDYASLWKMVTSGDEWRGEFHNRRKDGTLYWEAAQISPIRNSEGEITHFIKVAEDITERKRAEKEILKKNKDLEEFNKFAVTRELAMVKLKKEINTLLMQAGKEPRYKVAGEEWEVGK
ncbi:PAS domain S-box protein [bacterium]|nr:PAS domain S-box protein [bacterium]